MEKLKEIKSKEDFLRWAHDVNLYCENRRNNICDLQDVFYRGQDGDLKQLKTWYLEVSQTERQLLTFSIMKAMGEEMTFKFLKVWARRQADLVIEEYQKEFEKSDQELTTKRHQFNEEKKEIEARLPALQKEIEQLQIRLKEAQSINNGRCETINRLQSKISTLNTDLDEAYKDLQKTNQFKSFLKDLLKDTGELEKQIGLENLKNNLV